MGRGLDMIGKFRVAVITKDVQYKLNIERNITIIRGNSATGKTHLCDLINSYNQGEKSVISIVVQSEVGLQNVHCELLTAVRWKENLKLINNSIVFIDEDSRFVYGHDFKNAIEGSTNYYVIISRHIDGLENLPFSVNSVCEFTEHTKYVNNRKSFTINTLKPLWYLKTNDKVKISSIVTEDSKSGYKFYSHVCGGTDCKSANGKSNIPKLMKQNNSIEPTLFIVDGAAFGSNLEKIIELSKLSNNSLLYLPESFEWFLLHSLVFSHDDTIKKILDNPSKFIDSSKFISWERYFTSELKEVCANKGFQYNKDDNLDIRFLSNDNIKHLLSLIENIDFSKWLN